MTPAEKQKAGLYPHDVPFDDCPICGTVLMAVGKGDVICGRCARDYINAMPEESEAAEQDKIKIFTWADYRAKDMVELPTIDDAILRWQAFLKIDGWYRNVWISNYIRDFISEHGLEKLLAQITKRKIEEYNKYKSSVLKERPKLDGDGHCYCHGKWCEDCPEWTEPMSIDDWLGKEE